MCLELCFGTPKTCHLLTIHPQSFLIWVQDATSKNKKIRTKYDPNLSTTAFANRTLIELKLEDEKSLKVILYLIEYIQKIHFYSEDYFYLW